MHADSYSNLPDRSLPRTLCAVVARHLHPVPAALPSLRAHRKGGVFGAAAPGAAAEGGRELVPVWRAPDAAAVHTPPGPRDIHRYAALVL